MNVSEAKVRTANAVSYMKQLCRHWAHRFPVEFTDEDGRIELPQTLCTLTATSSFLGIRLDAPGEEVQTKMEGVVAEHLRRFGFKEDLVFDWIRF
jgi:hypothetical protein